MRRIKDGGVVNEICRLRAQLAEGRCGERHKAEISPLQERSVFQHLLTLFCAQCSPRLRLVDAQMWREGVGYSDINGDGLIVGSARHENVRGAVSAAHADGEACKNACKKCVSWLTMASCLVTAQNVITKAVRTTMAESAQPGQTTASALAPYGISPSLHTIRQVVTVDADVHCKFRRENL